MGNGHRIPGGEFGFCDAGSRASTADTAANSSGPRVPVAAEAGSSSAPQYVYVQGPPPVTQTTPLILKGIYLLISVLVALSILNLYLVITGRNQSIEATSKLWNEVGLQVQRLDLNDQRYAQLSGEIQVTSEKLGITEKEAARARALAAQYQKQGQQAVNQLNAALEQKASAADLDKLHTEADAKLGGLSNDLAGTRKDLDSTKAEFSGALAGAKGELNGAIARTHDELVALAHRTDRDYFEFQITRKNLHKMGNLSVELTKTNLSKNQFTINLYFDDKRMERKEKAIYEPVYFYMQSAPSALELVVNQLGKDTIGGYVSTPKGFFASVPNVLSSRPGA